MTPPDLITLEEMLAHSGWLRSLARGLVTGEDRAEDVVQQTWLTAIEQPPRHRRDLRAWLAAVARNVARQFHRTEGRRRQRELGSGVRRPAPPTAEVLASVELRQKIAGAVLGLDEPYRTTISLRYFEEMTPKEIAERYHISPSTVSTRIRRGLERLRARLDEEHGRDRRTWCVLLAPVLRRGKPARAADGLAGSAALVAGGLIMARKDRRRAAGPPPAPNPERTTTRETADEPPAGPATPGGLVATGRVLDDETGETVSGARVSLGNEFARRPDHEPAAVSGDDGTFRLERVPVAGWSDAFVTAKGYPEHRQSVYQLRPTGGSTAPIDLGDLRIHRGRPVSGRVLDDRGTTISDAAILIGNVRIVDGFLPTYSREVARSADDGTFVIGRVSPSTRFPYTLFAVTPHGMGWASLPGVAGREELRGIDITLRPSAGVTVQVLDADGNPLPGARVIALPRFPPLREVPGGARSRLDTWFGGHVELAGIFVATTDADGEARLTNLPVPLDRAQYDVGASCRDYRRARRKIQLTVDSTPRITLRLEPARTWSVAGIVHDVEGRPLEGVGVRQRACLEEESRTDASGAYRVEGLAASTEWTFLEYHRDGYGTAEMRVTPGPPGKVVTVDVTLERATPVSGRVRDQDGRPVAGALVSLLRSRRHKVVSGVKTDADGRFQIPGATAGEWGLSVHPSAPYDAWMATGSRPVVRGGDRAVEVVLARVKPGVAHLAVDVVDAATGEPLAPVKVMLVRADRDRQTPMIEHGKVTLGSGGVDLERVHAGTWRLWVQVPDRPAAFALVEVPEGALEVRSRIEVGRFGAIRGRLVSEEGLPLTRRPIFARFADIRSAPQYEGVPGGTTGDAVTDDDGAFVIERLMPAHYVVGSRTRSFVAEAEVVVPSGGNGTVRLECEKAATLRFLGEADSPGDVVFIEIAEGGDPLTGVRWMTVQAGTRLDFPHVARAGPVRWRVSFRKASAAGRGAPSAETQECRVQAKPGVTVEIPVPVRPR